MSSGLLFMSVCFSALMMASFSVRHRLHFFVSLEYAWALLEIDHSMVNGVLWCLGCQMFLESSVLFLCFSCRKDCRWLPYLSLNGGSVSPIYCLGLSGPEN